MCFLGAFVYDMKTDENFMTAKSKTFKHILNANQNIVSTPTQSQSVSVRRSQRISNQSQAQSNLVSHQRGKHASTQSQSVSSQRSHQISNQTQSHLVSHQHSQQASTQAQSVSFRRGIRRKQSKRDSSFVYHSLG